MPGYLRKATASQARALGPFIDSTDFLTPKTGLTIANTDIKLVVNGGASANKNSGGGTHRVNGVYGVTFDATDSATVGEIEVSVVVATALPVFDKFYVIEAAVFDALFASSAPGYLQPATAGRTLVIDAAGLADANMVKAGPSGSGTAQTARDVGASVLLSAGTGTGQLDFTSGVVKSNLAQILGTALTEAAGQIAAAFKKFFNIGTPASTMDALTLVATATNLTNAAGAGDFTTTMKTSIGTAVAASAVASVTARVTANTDQLAGQTVTAGAGVTFPTSVASPTNITAGTITTATNLTNAPTAGDLTAAMKTSVTTAATAATPTAAAVTGAVGSVTGAVGSVTGNVGGSVASVTGLTASDVGAIKAKTDNLTAAPADETLIISATNAIMARLGIPVTDVSTDIASVKTVANAVKAKTDNLPAIPAATGDAMTLSGAYDFAKGTAAMTESYAAKGAPMSVVQAIHEIRSLLAERSISGTTLTGKKLDGSTLAATYTLDDPVITTSQTRAT
jgi:hypothetical protein